MTHLRWTHLTVRVEIAFRELIPHRVALATLHKIATALKIIMESVKWFKCACSEVSFRTQPKAMDMLFPTHMKTVGPSQNAPATREELM